MKPTLDHVKVHWNLDDNSEYLDSPVVVYSQTFNDMLGLARDEWACFIIPEGEQTDGASWNPLITFLLWLDKRHRKIRLGALGHDYIYRNAGIPIAFYRFNKSDRTVGEYLGDYEVNQTLGDKFLRQKAGRLGANLYQRDAIHTGLHLFGNIAFNKYYKFNTRNNE